ncbi:hypothetical protein OQJ26_18130 [Legionella sp. PATHC038]|uniref:hypothetical protein n=1 Tax=Legionella sheltonii TaxID=2992041 RepID=UPI002243699C|nr:hypothetical protein [Legionella sp. PATHC038]MCW8400702.1 hypothetical protein [Legionella sp. PATHC038]
MSQKKFNEGAKNILDQLVHCLEKKDIPFKEAGWKNGKSDYVLTVKTPFGTRFARFNSVSLLEQEDLMTQEVNTYLINSLVKKLLVLKNQAQP